MIYHNILETIGNTPIIRINRLAPDGIEMYVKVEAFNPMGSVKDRLALGVIEAAEKISGIEGALAPVSNDGLSPDALQARLVQLVGDGPAILFTDLASGSCTFACRSVVRTRPALAVVTGANLANGIARASPGHRAALPAGRGRRVRPPLPAG